VKVINHLGDEVIKVFRGAKAPQRISVAARFE
jgi:hypothetical protein